ncbi:MAG: DUF4150 domain-containing protein [Deltaproteobacteria bacterium]|nr:DUF4150 domain-containing protein [Deltaproteobacteria bacterium]
MGANVFANGREVSAKKAGNRVSGAIPDPCLSPPSPPAGPIPVPYPNFSDDSKTDNGTKTVLIGGDQAGRKSDSSYKDCKGDEAATRNFGMGTISHTIQGEMKFVAWSFDVKFEGSNVPRHMDFMTGNHGSPATDGSTAPTTGKQKPSEPEDPDCKKLDAENEKARNEDLSEETRTSQSFTLTSALRKKDGITKIMFSAAPGDVESTNKNRKYQPTNSSSKMACTGEEYDARCKDHTEPKLLDPEWNSGGSIKMKIFHHTMKTLSKTLPDGTRAHIKKQVVDCMPCYSCKKSICAAEKCGLTVVLCNKDNKEVHAKDLCKDGKPQPPPKKKTRNKKDGTTEEYNDYTDQTAHWTSMGL